MKKVIILMLVVSFLCGCSNNNVKEQKNGVKAIDTATVFSDIDKEDIYIIDVREEYEYNEGHIKNAYNVSFTTLTEISKLNISLNSKIIVYCQSGNRSKMAARKLLEIGYTNVYDMGGINNWNYELIKE